MSRSDKQFYTPLEFAKLFHIDRQTLVYYDNHHIFSPIKRSESGYRYYSAQQILPFAEILALRNLQIPGSILTEYNESPTRDKLSELLSDTLEQQEELLTSLQQSIRHLKNMLRLLQDANAIPMGQIMVIPKSRLYYLRSSLMPAGESRRNAYLKSAPLIAEYTRQLFTHHAALTICPEATQLQDLLTAYPFRILLLSTEKEAFENPLSFAPSLYLTLYITGHLAPYISKLLTSAKQLSLTISAPILLTPLCRHDASTGQYKVEIAVKPATPVL